MPASPLPLTPADTDRPLVLGSTSPYRKALLERLGLVFSVAAPDVDETPQPGELPQALARRLAQAKAEAVARQHPRAWVIGSDQVADLAGKPLGKPGNHERAAAQLALLSGKTVLFHTGVSLTCQERSHLQTDVVTVSVRFRELTATDIDTYLTLEQPYDCAGSAKSEGLGIALLEAIDSPDPTALIGLPLIRTCQMLREAGWDVLAHAAPGTHA